MIEKLFLVGAAVSLVMYGQGVTVSPGQLDMLKLEGGPVSLGKKVSIQTTGKWTAAVDVDWIQASPARLNLGKDAASASPARTAIP